MIDSMDVDEVFVSDSREENISDAGILRRITAFIIDNIILFLFILFLLSQFFEYFNILKLLNSWAFSSFIYIIFFIYQIALMISESLWAGKTPGKYILNISAKNKDGSDAGFVQILVRNFLRCTYFLPPLFFIPDAICFFAAGKRRIGDLAAGTRVIKLK